MKCNHIATGIQYKHPMRGTPGPDLRALRERRDLTLKELARRAGLSFSQIAMIERGGNTTIERLDLLATALGCEMHIALYDPRERRAVVLDPEVAEAAERIALASPTTQDLLLALASVADQMRPEVRDMLVALVKRLERNDSSLSRQTASSNE